MIGTIIAGIKARIRRWLGVPSDNETTGLVADMLKGFNTRLDVMERDLMWLRSRQSAIGTDSERINRLKLEIGNLNAMVLNMSEALGGTWQTLSGFKRPICVLSDTHLDAIMTNCYGNAEARANVQREIDRRAEDDMWAARQGVGSLRDRVAALEELAAEPLAVLHIGPDFGPPIEGTFLEKGGAPLTEEELDEQLAKQHDLERQRTQLDKVKSAVLRLSNEIGRLES